MASWTLDLNQYGAKTMAQISRVFRRTGIDITSRIIFRTPVLSGLLRNNWFCSFGSPSSETTNHTGKQGTAALARATTVINSWDIDSEQSLFITNNLPYAEAIENGHSRIKAPAGMVKVVMVESGLIVEGAVRSERT